MKTISKQNLVIAIISFLFNIGIVISETNFEISNNLYQLNDQNFNDALKEFPNLMVIFTSHGNDENEKLEYLLSNVSVLHKDQIPTVNFGGLVSYSGANTTAKYQIQRYPSILYFQNNIKMVYQGGHTVKEVVSWLQRMVNDQLIIEVNDNNELKQLNKDNQIVLFYFVEDEKTKGFEEFKAAAIEYNDIQFAYSFSSTLRDNYNAGNNQLQLFLQFDRKKNTLNGPFTVSQIGQFLDKYSYQDLMPYNQRAKQRIMYKFLPGLFLITDDSEQGKAAEELMLAVARANKGKILFTITKPNDGFELFDEVCIQFSVRKHMIPAFRIQGFQGGESKYKYEDKFEQKNLEKFISQFRMRKLQQYYKSEPVPDNTNKDVKIIVADTFQQEVIQSDKDVFMDFWTTWCIACTNFEKTLQQLGKRLSKNPNLIIGKLNTGANELPNLKLDGLPTLKFYQKGKKNNPIKIEPGKTVDEYIKMFQQYSSSELIVEKDEL